MKPISRPFHPGTPWHLFRFEAPEAGAPAAVAEPAAPAGEAGGEPTTWVGPSQEQWEQQQQQLAALSHWAQQRAALEAQQARGQEIPRPDPFSDTFQEDLDRYLESRMAPLLSTHEQMELAAGEELAHDIIADNIAREGEFLHEGSKQLAFQLSRSFLPQAIQRYGYTDRAGEAALEMACKHVRDLESQIGTAYHERQINQLHTLTGARGEPAGSTPAAQITGGPYAHGQRVTDRFFGRG